MRNFGIWEITCLNLVAEPFVDRAAQLLKQREGMEYVNAFVSYDFEEIDRNYRAIAEKLKDLGMAKGPGITKKPGMTKEPGMTAEEKEGLPALRAEQVLEEHTEVEIVKVNSPIYCSGLREIDAILRDDEKLIQKVLDALKLLEEKRPEMIALVGSSVPMIIGADMEGIAAKIEHLTGIRSFGFSATRLRYYIHGIEMVDKKIIRRILEESSVIPQRREVSLLPM